MVTETHIHGNCFQYIFLNSGNTVGQEQALSMTDVVKQHFKDWCSQYFYNLYMGNLLEPQQMHDTCGTTVHTEIVDRALI
jgi:hypothetical protein